jgi:putative ABC transport system permease protein
MRRESRLHDVIHDLRISLRGLLRVPWMTLTVLVTVGLGIGATTAIFGAINAALLRPLPYADPERLVWIYTDAPPFQFRFSVADYLALEAQQTQFERVAGFTSRTMTFNDGSAAELIEGRVVTWTYFSTLGITPALGRDFGEADARPGSPPAVIVSHGFWQQRLGGRRAAIATPIRLDGADYVLAGVLPPAVGPLEARRDFFVAAQLATPPRRGPFPYWVVGRLRPGVDPAAATSELRAINRRIFPIWKASYQDEKATWSLLGLQSRLVGSVRTTAGLALSAVALVWLIACVNASNLLVARVTSRRRELAVRAALGASRGRVVRHMLVESGLLAAGAALVGVVLAWVGIRVLRGVGADYFPRTQEMAFDGPVLAVLAAATLLSGAIFGLIPAVHGTGGPLDDCLRSAGRSSTGSLSVRRLRRLLVGAQFAISTPLLVVAVLLLVSLNELKRVDLGVDSRNVVTGSVRLPSARYQSPASVTGYWEELSRRLRAVPGVSDIAFADSRPPDGASNINNFDLEALPTPPGGSQPATPWVAVTPEYFGALGVPLLEGRLLDARDAEREALESVVVDRAWARRFFPGDSAIGKRFKEGGCTRCPWTTVVGVVGDVKYAGLEQPDQGTVYTPMAGGLSRFVVLRTQGDSVVVLPSVRQAIRALDPDVPMTSVATIDELVAESLESPRALSLLVAGFALVALALSAVGIYGVMAYYVQQQARDISIRLALGGRPADVLRLVIGEGMLVVLGGVLTGLVTAYASTRLLSSLLFGVGAADVPTFVAVTVFLLTVALLACLVPARRAIALEPAAVLRSE